MKNIIIKSLFLLIMMLFTGCGNMCSGDKPKSEDLIKLKRVSSKFETYNIEIDECLPFGYFNVIVGDENEIDTLLIDKIFYEVLESNITPQEMQVLNKKGELLYVQNNYYNPNTGENKAIRLKPEDL